MSTFDDRQSWWFPGDGHSAAAHGRYQVGWTGVNVPQSGTVIRVDKEKKGDRVVEVSVNPTDDKKGKR